MNPAFSTLSRLLILAQDTTSNPEAVADKITPKPLVDITDMVGEKLAKATASLFHIPVWVSEILISAIIIAIFWFAYKIVKIYGRKFLLRLTAKTKTDIDDKVIGQVITPVGFIVFTFGVYVALMRLSILSSIERFINMAYVATLTFVGIFIVSRLFRILLEWYAQSVAERTQSPIDTEFIPTLRKVINIVIWIMGLLLILDQLGYPITTLLAGLGIGGLAVALALQDTLNNFFSGFYMMIDRPLRVGDFVHLDDGNEGFIEQIGWRTTRIRTFASNIIVIPNAKLAQSVITNYFLPGQLTKVYVQCGVGYESDLYQVEKICIEVGKELAQKVEGADPDFEPIVRYNSFGDSNINLTVIMQVKDFGVKFLMAHEYMKAIFHRFKKENIEIAFPKRSIYIESMPTPPVRRQKQDTAPQPGLFDSGESKES